MPKQQVAAPYKLLSQLSAAAAARQGVAAGPANLQSVQGPYTGQIMRILVCWDFEPLKVGSTPYRLGRY